MMLKRTFFILPLLLAMLVIVGCGGEDTRRTDVVKSGRLEYVQYMRYGRSGVHGGNSWYVNERELKVNGRTWKPEGIDLKMITCEASPNKSVEALKCGSYARMKELTYIFRIKDDAPEVVIASEFEFVHGDDSGAWADDGHWLIFRDRFFNIETSEKRDIKYLPDEPGKYFIAASPDLETILYREICYNFVRDKDSGEVTNMPEYIKQCKEHDDRVKKGIEAFWLIEAKTGEIKILELPVEYYPFAKNPSVYLTVNWKKEFLSKLSWEKDNNGKYQPVIAKQTA